MRDACVTALATSVTSARVGRGFTTIDSNIWVAMCVCVGGGVCVCVRVGAYIRIYALHMDGACMHTLHACMHTLHACMHTCRSVECQRVCISVYVLCVRAWHLCVCVCVCGTCVCVCICLLCVRVCGTCDDRLPGLIAFFNDHLLHDINLCVCARVCVRVCVSSLTPHTPPEIST
jgi:hypothetical protein